MTKKLLQEYVDDQADLRPDAIALVDGKESFTYGDLASRSNQLARVLREAGCCRGDRVGILLPKSPEALISMFAVLKADCIYVPMDIASPSSRLQIMLEACGSSCLLAASASATLVNDLILDLRKREQMTVGWIDSQPAPAELKVAFNQVT